MPCTRECGRHTSESMTNTGRCAPYTAASMIHTFKRMAYTGECMGFFEQIIVLNAHIINSLRELCVCMTMVFSSAPVRACFAEKFFLNFIASADALPQISGVPTVQPIKSINQKYYGKKSNGENSSSAAASRPRQFCGPEKHRGLRAVKCKFDRGKNSGVAG